MKVAVIGGGAAGFFSAIHVKENHPNATVIIYEKTKKVLSKVKVSGGGRCNVTNGTKSISELYKAYPRGGKKIKKYFKSLERRIPLIGLNLGMFPYTHNKTIEYFLNLTTQIV